MLCKVCRKPIKWNVCKECKEVLEWMYPDQRIDEILENYRLLRKAHYFLGKEKGK